MDTCLHVIRRRQGKCWRHYCDQPATAYVRYMTMDAELHRGHAQGPFVVWQPRCQKHTMMEVRKVW